MVFVIRQKQNDIKKNSVQLSWNTTLICCQFIIYIIKKERKLHKNWGVIKPDPVNNPNVHNKKDP